MLALRARICEIWQDRSGNFGLLLGVLMVPLALIVGVGIDYGYALTIKKELQAAADNAAVGALAEQSAGVIAALSESRTGTLDVAEEDADQLFTANAASKALSYLVSRTISVKREATTFQSNVGFTAEVPTSFLMMFGLDKIAVSGVSSATYTPSTYVDFYLMLDNSPSMGLGATVDDIAKLENATSGMASDPNCAFACHIENSTDDRYSLAKSLGIISRIKMVTAAAQSMIETAISKRRWTDQYRMSVYSLGESARNAVLTQIAAPSTDLVGVKTATATIDLMSIPYQGFDNDQQTDLLTNLNLLKDQIGISGEGLNATDRQKVLFLVSDGVEDAARGSACNKETTDGTRCQQPLDTAACSAIKQNGVRIAVLYTTYQPVNNNGWYTSWIKPFQSEISTSMQACATEGLFFEVSPSQGIAEAMNALFYKVVNMPRLTG